MGLSPRVWGNHWKVWQDGTIPGSIPTGMGKPDVDLGAFASSKVYPHGYGETMRQHSITTYHEGLSPRVWGNPPETET